MITDVFIVLSEQKHRFFHHQFQKQLNSNNKSLKYIKRTLLLDVSMLKFLIIQYLILNRRILLIEMRQKIV
jgi:hypothetical protein